MRKIFFYECRRLLCNKFFLGLLLVILFYGWQVLNRVTIFGHRAHSALFSLELWRLSLPHAAAFVDGRAVFPELFQR